MAEQDSSLDFLLNKATNPALGEEDWELILAFCDQVNKELEGPQISCRLLSHKIQSPQEREALYALTALEACVKNCGKYFHQEVGKFRFLNEMIKVVSPKYLGNKTTERVKKRCIELIYSWQKGLPHEMKIQDAYKMLKTQGIVKEDPTYVDKTMDPPPSPKPKNSIFEDEEKSKLLSRLLRSKNQDDLQAANRLIKNMVKQDNDRMEKVSRRINQLETVNNNVKLLTEMLQNYSPGNSSQSDREIMKELYMSLEKLRPSLFRLASDADDKDNDALGDILKANDSVSRTLQQYKSKVEGISENGVTHEKTGGSGDSSALLDLNFDQSLPKSHSSQPAAASSDTSDTAMILEGELTALGLQDTEAGGTRDYLLNDLEDIFGTSGNPVSSDQTTSTLTSDLSFNPVFPTTSVGASPSLSHSLTSMSHSPLQSVGPGSAAGAAHHVIQAIRPPPSSATVLSHPMAATVMPQSVFSTPAAMAGSSGFTVGSAQSMSFGQQGTVGAGAVTNLSLAMDDLDILGQTLADHGLPKEQLAEKGPKQPVKIPLNQIVTQQSQQKADAHSNPSSHLMLGADQIPMPHPAAMGGVTTSMPQNLLSLTDVFVPLESVKPGDVQPINAYDKNGIKVVMHFAKDRPQEHILVVVVSVMSTKTQPVKNFLFQAAVPKAMKVKLQTASASDLPAYNPILPLSAITQVMLIANPAKERVRLKFKIMYSTEGQNYSDVGDVENFPVQ
ncbi:hypothetical protein ScPMuIL_003956 [Solemya velum]